MAQPIHLGRFQPRFWRVALLAGLTFSLAGLTHAQVTGLHDDPTAHSHQEVPKPAPPPDTFTRVCESICWYIPNRVMDFTDIFRFHVSFGDGIGASVRATKWLLWASWFHDNAFCLGWTKRTVPLFGEQYDERYFAFLAAQEGATNRDPTEVGLSLHLAVIGANVAVSLGEALDFITGVFGVDLENDDHGPMLFDYTEKNEVHRVPDNQTMDSQPMAVPTPVPAGGNSGDSSSIPTVQPVGIPTQSPIINQPSPAAPK